MAQFDAGTGSLASGAAAPAIGPPPEVNWTIEPPGTGAEVVIPDEPRVVDPVTLLPEQLRRKVTVNLDAVPLTDVADWLQQNLAIPVRINATALQDAGIDPDEAMVSERVNDLPAYLLLNRMLGEIGARGDGLAWYLSDDMLWITTAEAAAAKPDVRVYSIAELLKEGCTREGISDAIDAGTGGEWFRSEGYGGSMNFVGHLLFVRGSYSQQLEVAALLSALERHGRETAVLEPVEHVAIRDKLDTLVSVDFHNAPLRHALAVLSELAVVEIRIDQPSLADAGVSGELLVTYAASEEELGDVLKHMFQDVGGVPLTAYPQDGAYFVTTWEAADRHLRTVVCDVRDLCRVAAETDALKTLIMEATEGPWCDVDGICDPIIAPRPGTLVIRQTEAVLSEVRALLAEYRAAMKISGRPTIEPVDRNERITRYYRVPAEMGDPLARLLPGLVAPDSWKSEAHPDGGQIDVLPGGPEIVDGNRRTVAQSPTTEAQSRTGDFQLIPQAVLVVRQTRANHVKIGRILTRMQTGDPLWFADEQAQRAPEGDAWPNAGSGNGFFSITPPTGAAQAPLR